MLVLLCGSMLTVSAQQGPPKPVLTAAPSAAASTPTAQTAVSPPASVPPPSAQESNPAVSAATGQTSAPANVSSSYIIGLEDVLQVNVWKEASLSGSIPVRPDGMISLPLVGDIQASGFTPMQLSSQIATRLKKYVNDPSVTVTLSSVHPKQIFLLGEVGHVGALTLTDGMTPLQAISAAGGVTAYANVKHIYILRGEPGKQQKLPFNYKVALKTGNQQNITLLPGDTIVIP